MSPTTPTTSYRVAAGAHVPADRVAVGQPAADSRFVHDHDPRRAVHVAAIEQAPALQRCPDRGEVIGRDAGDRDLLIDVGRGGRRAVDGEIEDGSLSAHRQHRRRRHGSDAGQCAKAVFELGHAIADLLGALVALALERQAEGHRVLRREARVHAHHRREAADEEARTGQQDHRERHFGHDEGRPHPMTPRGGAAAAGALAQARGDAAAGRLERGQQPERDARQQRDRDRVGDDQTVETDLAEQRDVRGLGRHEGARRPGGEDEADTRAREPQHERLGQQLPEEPGARGAEGGAQRELLLARRGAREEQVGHVGAGDEEHEADGTQEDEQGPSHVADHEIVEADRREGQRRVRLGKGRLQSTPDALQIGEDLRQRHARAGAADHGQVLVAARRCGRGVEGRAVLERRVHVSRRGEVSPPREHTDDRVRIAAHFHHPSDRGQVAAELALPEAVVEHGRVAAPALMLLREEAAPDRHLQAEHREEAVADGGPADFLRLAGAEEGEQAVPGTLPPARRRACPAARS